MTSLRRVLVVAVATFLLCAPAYAQTAGNIRGAEVTVGQPSSTLPEVSAPSFGTAAETSIVIQATQWQPPAETVGYSIASIGGGIGIWQSTSTGTPDWWIGFQIPNGAQLTKVVVEACDSTATGQHSFGIAAGTAPGVNAINISPIVQTGLAATPGCAFFTLTPSSPTFANNQTQNFWIFNAWFGTGSAFSSAMTMRSIRPYYRLQVSAAPGSASFSDVPTNHPFFRFIEALVAAGITGGCGGGNYCPTAPVTRGEMAVFLAVALGLHFPN